MPIVIGMLLENRFPPDIRVSKESKALIEAGITVHVLCPYEANKPSVEIINGLHVHRAIKYPTHALELAYKTAAILTFVNQVWIKALPKFINDNNITHLHVHDLPLVGTAVKIRRKFPQLRIVADLHENYPAAVREWGRSDQGLKALFSKYINNYERWNTHERNILEKVDHVIAVVDEMKNRILNNSSLSSDKITVVSNQEDREFLDDATIHSEIVDRYKSQFTVLYIGGFGPHRGLEVAIEGMKHLKEHPIKLLLVGKGRPAFEKKLHDIAQHNDVTKSVEFLSWQPSDHVPSYISSASICIIPHNSNEHTDNTIPHKLFQYMMLGKPIIVSSSAPLARVVGECNSGLVFEAGNPLDFSNKVLELFKDKERSSQLAQNGKNMTYNGDLTWRNESKKLISLYRSLV